MSLSENPTTPQQDGRTGASGAVGDLRARVGSATAGFTQAQKARMALVFVAVAGAILGYSFLQSQTTWAPLMQGLAAEDVAAVTEALSAQGIEYELTDGGSTIRVPEDAVYQARADIAQVDMPSSGKIGYGILDNQSLTTSEFGQRVGYKRALEGEMAKTIEAIDGVELATVHLALPRSDAFVLDEQEASASVMVTTAKDGTLRSSSVQAIVNLVASGVDGLSADRVTVADSKGNVLAAPGGVTASEGGNDATEAYEGAVSNRLEEMLAAAVGPGHAKVTVSAELDFDATSTVTETFEAPTAPDPAKPLLRSEDTKSEEYNGAAAATDPEGPLGVDGEPTGAADTATGTDYRRTEQKLEPALNKSVVTTNEAPGAVTRMSVAVVLNEAKVDAARIPDIEALVAAGAGVDPERGDTVQVVRMAFDEQVTKALEEDLKKQEALDTSLPIWVYGAGGVALLAVIGLILVLRKAKKAQPEAIEALALPAGDGERVVTLNATPRATATAGAPTLVGAGVGATAVGSGNGGAGVELVEPGTERREVLGELIDNQPDEVAQLLRSWLGDRREVSR